MNKHLLFLLLSLLPIWSAAQSSFTIKKDKTFILIDKRASAPALLAAHELQYFINQSLGIKLPIVNQLSQADAQAICVGTSEYTRKLNRAEEQLAAQEYIIEISSKQIFLLGKDQSDDSDYGRDNNGITPANDRLKINYSQTIGDSLNHIELTLPSIYDAQATCYAVYDFLENFLGIRFYGPHPLNVIVPAHPKMTLSATRIKRSPAIKYRDSSYSFDWPMMKEQYLGATNEMCQLFLRRIKFGGEKWAGNHAFTSYQDRFLKKNPACPELFEGYHPEYFATGRTGGPHERQFCYTNPAFIQQVATDACDYFAGKPLKGAQIALGDYFAVIPLDNAHWCTCDECKKQLAVDKENIRGEHFNCGTATNYLWRFVNNVAKEVKEEYPDKKIAALAYHVYAYMPKEVKLEKNVSVAPCLHPRNYWSPKMKENELTYYKEWIAESRKSGRSIYLWNYLCFPTERGLVQKFNVFPGFSIHEVGKQIKMYAKDKVRGIFLCGIGEQLDFYITMQLYNDPRLNVDQLITDFFTSYFGAAAQPMYQFYLKIEQVYSDTKNYPIDVQTKDAQFHQTEEIAWKYLGTDAVMSELERYIEQAQLAEVNPAESQRIDSWAKGVWDYMKSGKKNYQLKAQNR